MHFPVLCATLSHLTEVEGTEVIMSSQAHSTTSNRSGADAGNQSGDELQPHRKFAWLQQGPEGYPPVPALPKSFVVTTTTADDLWENYRRLVKDTPGMEEHFETEMRLEDEYHAIVRSIIHDAGADAELAFYEGPEAFTGGAKAGWDLLHMIASQVRRAAINTGLPGLPLMVGIWPDAQMNARSVEIDGGVLAYVNTGLLVMLRMACQYVASSLQAIDGAKHWGPDAESQENLSTAFLSRIDAYRAGVDPRVKSTVRVMRGEREMFRRQLNYVGIVYVVAHEYGHALARRYVDYFWPTAQREAPRDPPTLSVQSLMQPRSEEEEAGSGWYETLADLIAFRIMSTPPLIGEAISVVTLIAPSVVMGMQSALWWKDRAEGKDEFAWTHPLPDLRMRAPILELAPDEESMLSRQGHVFLEWLVPFLRLGEARELAIEQAKRGKGGKMQRLETLVALGMGEDDG